MSLVLSSFNGASTPFVPGGSAAKRKLPPSRASWRGLSEMSDGRNFKQYGKNLKFEECRSEAALVAFLKAKHPVKTVACVAADTGTAADTIGQWLRGYSRPGFGHIGALIYAYRAEFVYAVYYHSRAWSGPAWKPPQTSAERPFEELRQRG